MKTNQIELITEDFFHLCGIDEAGRGPLAGPVLAAAVVLPKDFPFEILNDSKKLSEKKRIEIEKIIKEKALCWGIALAKHELIDTINILQATMFAMENAFVEMLKQKNIILNSLTTKGFPEFLDINLVQKIIKKIIIDGNIVPKNLKKLENYGIDVEAIPKADALFPSVMAASILAKNERDRIMCEYAKIYPEYLYEKHKGYPTALHKEICKKRGPSPIQRRTFRY